MNNENLDNKKIMISTFPVRELNITRGNGVYLYDDKGNKYLDLMTNIGVSILGHNCKAINSAITDQLSKISNIHWSFHNKVREKAAAKLISITPKNLNRIYFGNSGAEAVEAAIKFSMIYSGRRKIISAKLGYHGKTLATLSATTSSPKYRKPFLPLIPGFEQIRFNDEEELKETVNKDTAALILEPIQGESGIKLATKQYLKAARDICNDTETVLIFDEVQTGFRTGHWTASELYNVEPDIICLSKGIANGLAMSATLTTEEIAETVGKSVHSSTFGGNPLVCAASLATINYIEQNNLLSHSKEIGSYFMSELNNLDSPLIRDVRGAGLMIGLDLKKKSSEYLKKLQEKGIIAAPASSTVLRFLPPLIIQKEHVDRTVEELNNIL